MNENGNVYMDRRFMRVAILLVVGLVGVTALVYVVASTSESAELPEPQSIEKKLFLQHKAAFLECAAAVRAGKAAKRKDGVVGYEVPPQLAVIGVAVIDVDKDCVFFEATGNTFASRGLAFTERGQEMLAKAIPPTEPKVVRLEEIEPNWFTYMAK